MIRYLGYSELPAARTLARRLEAEQGEHIANGVHLIVVRSADDSLVVGDSHHYAATPDPFAPSHVDDFILDEYARVFDGRRQDGGAMDGDLRFGEGSPDAVDPPDALRVVLITSGTGASTSFVIAEEIIADLFGAAKEKE